MRRLAAGLLFFLIAGCGSDGGPAPAEIPTVIAPLETVTALRNYVHWQSVRGIADGEFTQEDLLALEAGAMVAQCGKQGSALIYLLEQEGFAARGIGAWSKAYVEGVDASPTHYFVEVWGKDGWVAVDPMFNLYWTCDDSPDLLSAQGMQQCKGRGGLLVSIRTEPFRDSWYGDIDQYPDSIASLIYKIVYYN